MEKDYITKTDLAIFEAHISNRINETFWKFIPIVITVQFVMSSLIAASMFLIAKVLVEK